MDCKCGNEAMWWCWACYDSHCISCNVKCTTPMTHEAHKARQKWIEAGGVVVCAQSAQAACIRDQTTQ